MDPDSTMEGGPEPRRRSYNSTRRARQAALTRSDVLTAAIELFGTTGWAGTTMASVARAAGVAVETVYGGFGSKKQLLRAAVEASVVGDADDEPLAEREEFQRLSRGSRPERMQAGVTLLADIHERSSGVWQALLEAASGDPEIDGWRRELDLGRRVEVGRALEAIFDERVEDRPLDVIWALQGPEVYLRLTRDAGMDRATYEATIVDATLRLLGRTSSGARARSSVGRGRGPLAGVEE